MKTVMTTEFLVSQYGFDEAKARRIIDSVERSAKPSVGLVYKAIQEAAPGEYLGIWSGYEQKTGNVHLFVYESYRNAITPILEKAKLPFKVVHSRFYDERLGNYMMVFDIDTTELKGEK